MNGKSQTIKKSFNIKRFILEQPVFIIFLLFAIVMGILKPNFLGLSNVRNLFMDISVYGVVACTMTIAIICGEFDLSASSTFIWSQILFCVLLNHWGQTAIGIIAAMIVTLISGMIIGSINGIIVTRLKINSFITTLGMMIIIKGVALVFTDGKMVSTSNKFIASMGTGTFLGIPYLIYIYVVFVLVAFFVMKYTRFGRNIFATGGNVIVAKLSGIRTAFYKYMVFVIIGFASALAGIMLVSQVRAGSVLYGTDLSLTAVAATVIGGTSLSGGSGSVTKTFFGMLVLGLLYKALIFLGLQAYYQNLIKGLVLVVVVAMDAYLNRSGNIRR
ncbi:MAG: ABC transporter permease [Candidatus Humimicrobiaceae bacterium]